MSSAQSGKPAALPHPHPTESFWHTEPSALLQGHRTTRSLPDEVDIVVVGSGMTGASIVWHLFEPYRNQASSASHATDVIGKAPHVLLLEAREICWGATGRNGGHCQPLLYTHPSDPEIGHFELLNHATLANLTGSTTKPAPSTSPYYPSVPTPPKTFPAEFVVQPGVRGFYTPREADKMAADLKVLAASDASLAAHCRFVTDRNELAALRVPTACAAVVTDVAARMWPYKFIAGVMEDMVVDPALEGKLNVQTWTPVEGLGKGGDGRWEVKTERGTVRAKEVVLATNGYTSHLLPEFADLIVPCRGQMSALKPPAELRGEQRLKTSLGFEGGGMDDYLVQRDYPAEHLMFGGGGQTDGTRLGESDDSTIDEKTAEYLRSNLPKVFNLEDQTELEAVKMWTGIMGFSRDELAFVGPVPGRDGVWTCSGFTGHGMPNTWLSGKAVARMVSKTREGSDVAQAVSSARYETGLPRSYVLDQARLDEARKRPTVLEQYLAFFHAGD